MKEFQRSGKHGRSSGGELHERRFRDVLMACDKRWTLKVTVLHGLASLQWLYGHLDSTCWRMLWWAWKIKKPPGALR